MIAKATISFKKHHELSRHSYESTAIKDTNNYHPILIALKYILLGLAHRIGEKEKQRKII